MPPIEASIALTADARDTSYERVLAEYGPAIQRLAASYEARTARREDLVQDIHLAIWQALPRFRGDSSERTFVFRIAHNRAISHSLRSRRRETEPLDEVPPPVDTRANPEQSACHAEQRRRLRQAVRELRLGLRQVIVLALEGLPPREIGEVLGISENNVAVRMSRARQALRQRLAHNEAT